MYYVQKVIYHVVMLKLLRWKLWNQCVIKLSQFFCFRLCSLHSKECLWYHGFEWVFSYLVSYISI